MMQQFLYSFYSEQSPGTTVTTSLYSCSQVAFCMCAVLSDDHRHTRKPACHYRNDEPLRPDTG